MATTPKKAHTNSEAGKALRRSEHFAQFYETDAFLVDSVSEFIGTGLRAGDACIVIATQPHRESLEELLKVDGLEVPAARLQGQYVSMDAAATLSKFMIDGLPEPGRFAEVVGGMIAQAAKGRSRVRIFGEMVALLWADRNRAGAIRLEELWNDLGKAHPFLLLCSYPMHDFRGEVYEAEFTEICQQHSRVLPAESYTALASPEERLRAITLLQQKAHSLEVEIAERKAAEERAQFLAEVSKVLASTLDDQETLANIARLVVPQLADWFAVDLVDAAGHFELIEVEHSDPDKVRRARELRSRFPLDPNAPVGVPNVARTGRAELYPDIPDELLVAAARNEEELAISRQVGYTSVMLVPLVARGRTIGVVTFVSAESGRKYNEADLALAKEVGRRTGVALDNARLYREARQARDQLDIILQGVADGIIVYDKHSRIIYANEAAAQLTGFASVQAMMQTPPLGIVSKYKLVDEQGQPFTHSQLTHRRALAREGEAQATIGYSNTVTGQPERWSLVKSRPVFDEQRKVVYVITIIHDVTEGVQAERRKDEFISMASHELKTPVTSLKGFTNVLQRRLAKQGDEQGLHYLARVDAQLNKLTKLISDLLDISKMQAGKLELREEAFDLEALVHETVENVQAASTTHRLLIEGRAEVQVVGDKERLGQVFINLLTNAIKYSPQADTVIVRLSREQEQAIVSVQDFGIGIDKAYHQKIFERFYQVTDPMERTYPGLGIGLYISHEIVARHHGRLWLESSKGEGTTFFVALPLTKQE